MRRHPNYEWVIEGDIHDCFGSIAHDILMRQLRRRIGDKRLLTLIWRMLRAGVLEDLRYYSADAGTPQGGIVSPLLANVYMHQLDEWAVAHSHGRTKQQKYRRRSQGMATLRLTRYADAFVIAVKGTREQADAIKTEVAEFLHSTMRMTLSLEKPHTTHRTEGFVFLGVTVRYTTSHNLKDTTGRRRENVYYLPSPKAIQRYKAKVAALTGPEAAAYLPVESIRAINRFSAGWGNYYRHANSAKIFETLDHWTWWTVFRWLQRRYQLGPRAAYERFYVAANTPINPHPRRKDRRLGAWEGGHHLAIWPLAFTPIRYWKYRGTHIPQKYANAEDTRAQTAHPNYDTTPWPEGSNPHHTTAHRNAREQVRLQRKFRCERCNILSMHTELHHKDGNPENNDPSNWELLCEKCHKATSSYGKRKTQ